MRKIVLALTLALCTATFAGIDEAEAALICTIKAERAESHGHKTSKGALARAWVNWQGTMRNRHQRRFSAAMARNVRGYPKTSRRSRFNHSATVAAYGCYRKGVSCVTGTGITPGCECQSDRSAAIRQNCSVYRAGR